MKARFPAILLPFSVFTVFICLAVLVTNTAKAESLSAIVPVDQEPFKVAVNPANGNVYVANSASDTVSVISPSNQVIATIPVGSFPYGLAIDSTDNDVYVVNRGSNTVSVISPSNQVIATIPVGVAPEGIVFNPTNDDIYVSNPGNGNEASGLNFNTVSVISGSANQVIATIPVGEAPFVSAVNPNTGNVYVINVVSNTVSVISSSNQVIATIPLGASARPQDVAVNPVSGNVYVANIGSSTVSVISGSTNQVIATIPVGFGSQYLAVNPNTGNVYVNNVLSNTVSAISPSNQVIASIPVGREPQRVAVNPDSGNVYVANDGGPDRGINPSTISVISPSNQVIATIPLGTPGHGIAVNDNTGNVYVTNGGSNSVSVISSTDTTIPIPPYTAIINADVDGFRIQDGDTTLSTFIRFTFSATPGTNPIASFECSLDASQFSTCATNTDPGIVSYNNLAAGQQHTFKVRAVDTQGNKDPSPATLTWTILTPSQAVHNIISTIDNMHLSKGTTTSLKAPLNAAINQLNHNNRGAACNTLNAFLNQVNAKEANGQLTSQQAADLRQQATAIESSLGCSSTSTTMNTASNNNNNDQESTSSISSASEKQQEQALINLRSQAEHDALSSMIK